MSLQTRKVNRWMQTITITIPLDDPRRKDPSTKVQVNSNCIISNGHSDSETNPHQSKRSVKESMVGCRICRNILTQAGNPVFSEKGKAKKYHNAGDVYPYDAASESWPSCIEG